MGDSLGEPVPRPCDRAADLQAGRGRPHRGGAHTLHRQGPSGGQGGAPDRVQVRLTRRAGLVHADAAARGAWRARDRHPGGDRRGVPHDPFGPHPALTGRCAARGRRPARPGTRVVTPAVRHAARRAAHHRGPQPGDGRRCVLPEAARQRGGRPRARVLRRLRRGHRDVGLGGRGRRGALWGLRRRSPGLGHSPRGRASGARRRYERRARPARGSRHPRGGGTRNGVVGGAPRATAPSEPVLHGAWRGSGSGRSRSPIPCQLRWSLSSTEPRAPG